MTEIFKVGERVRAFGVEGTVCFSHDDIFPVNVRFESGHFELFTEDGRAALWHKEPVLQKLGELNASDILPRE